jgi:sporulation protein YlmC with PRC-barrel domain
LHLKIGGGKMVELSNLYGLDIYTVRGNYVGRVQDVVLNIKKGRVSNLKVRAMSPEKKNVGLKEVIKTSISYKIVPEADEIRPLKEEGVMDIAYDRVQAVGDILLISQDVLKAAESAPTTQ